MTEDTGYCLFCGQLIELTKGRSDVSNGVFKQAWVTKIEIEDCFGHVESRSGKGSMFICHACRSRMNTAIENNALLVSQ